MPGRGASVNKKTLNPQVKREKFLREGMPVGGVDKMVKQGPENWPENSWGSIQDTSQEV